MAEDYSNGRRFVASEKPEGLGEQITASSEQEPRSKFICFRLGSVVGGETRSVDSK